MIILNDDLSKVKKGGRKAPKISMDDFKKELLKFLIKHNPDDVFNTKEFMASLDPFNGVTDSSSLLSCLFYAIEEDSTVNKDLDKIQFGYDNGAASIYNEFYPGDFIGLKTTKTGLPFLGVCSCGDEEYREVFFILYFDGIKIRGYIPYYTNTYNPKTKAAFGMEYVNEDAEFLNKMGINCEYDEDLQEYNFDILDNIDCDPAKLIYDVEQRIIVI